MDNGLSFQTSGHEETIRLLSQLDNPDNPYLNTNKKESND